MSFGMSLGGMIAQELALARPERVRALVLGCTHAGVRHAAPQPQEAARAFAMRTDDWALRMRTLAPFAFSPGVDPELLRAFVEKKSRDVQAEEGYRAQIAAVLSHDTAGRLAGVSARTLVVTGDDDRIIPAASSHRLHERIPDATLKVIAGAGHIFFLERPDATERLLRDFLDGGPYGYSVRTGGSPTRPGRLERPAGPRAGPRPGGPSRRPGVSRHPGRHESPGT